MFDDLRYFEPLTEDDYTHSKESIISNLKHGIDSSEVPTYRERITLYDCGMRLRRPIRHKEGFDGRKDYNSQIFGEVKTMCIEKKQPSVKILVNDFSIERLSNYTCFFLLDIYSADSPTSLIRFVGNMQKKMLPTMKILNERGNHKDIKHRHLAFSLNQLMDMGLDVFRDSLSVEESFAFLKKHLNKKNFAKVSEWTTIPHHSEVDWDAYYISRN